VAKSPKKVLNNFKNILILAPHTDDGEFGCGGTIAKLVELGATIHYVAFSTCEESLEEGYPKDILVQEVKKATSVLGVLPQNLHILNYKVRYFNYNRQEILEDIVKLGKQIQPDLVFIPSVNDIHQDHSTIEMEGLRAFKKTNLLSYELAWNNISFNHAYFVRLEERHVAQKISALTQYVSQMHRPYANKRFIESLALTKGVQIGADYAEVFEVVRLISQ
jgi:N-acetylglucosamine malate deacetylase 1